MTETELILQNIEGECATIKLACERGGVDVVLVGDRIYEWYDELF